MLVLLVTFVLLHCYILNVRLDIWIEFLYFRLIGGEVSDNTGCGCIFCDTGKTIIDKDRLNISNVRRNGKLHDFSIRRSRSSKKKKKTFSEFKMNILFEVWFSHLSTNQIGSLSYPRWFLTFGYLIAILWESKSHFK